MRPDQWLVLARWVGAHAWLVFVALLCLLLLLMAFIAWVWDGQVLRRTPAAFSPPAVLLLNVAAGFSIVLGAAFGFAEIAEHLGPGGAMSQADEALSASIRSHVGVGTQQVFARLTHLGDPLVLTLLGVAVALWLCWRGQRSLALGWALALGGNALLNPVLKRVFERVRPVHDHGLVAELGWSFPSGHTSGATVAYGMLAYVLLRTLPKVWHLPVVLGATSLAFSVGSSRVFLQLHFASDVVAGFASGTAWLMVCISSVGASQRWRLMRSP
jgi:membrane-associated phospholipid phosphatase